jgi:hypothetical protein
MNERAGAWNVGKNDLARATVEQTDSIAAAMEAVLPFV